MQGGRQPFLTTRWSMVLAAGGQSSDDSREALASLCEAYWFPIYTYARRRVRDAAEAQDLTQSFFAELLEKDYVASAAPKRGRFRSFLLAAFRHFLSKHWRAQRTLKRGGGRTHLPLDFEAAGQRFDVQPFTELTAEQLFDRQWTVTLLGQVMDRLEKEWTEAGKAGQFNQLKPFLVGESSGATYRQAGDALRMSEGAAKMAAHRLRLRYRELLRDEIAATVSGPEEADDEIRRLFATLESKKTS